MLKNYIPPGSKCTGKRLIKAALQVIFLSISSMCLAQPTITSVSSMVAAPGASVVITGTNFDASPANNIVYFGATRATVTSAGITSLSVTVPVGATYSPITVQNAVTHLQGASVTPFLPGFDTTELARGKINMEPNLDLPGISASFDVAISDIDGDGKPDIIVSDPQISAIIVYRNISVSGSLTTGSFAAGVSFTTYPYSIGLAVGDLDNDGKPDIAVASEWSGISVLRNLSIPGTISFADYAYYNTDCNITDVIIVDLDGDGKAELVANGSSAEDLVVLKNISVPGFLSYGGFEWPVHFALGGRSGGIVAGDIDGDGKKDLAIIYANTASVALFRNTAVSGTPVSGWLAEPVNFSVSIEPKGVDMADIDGDGKQDIIISHRIDKFSVFRNTATAGSITSGSLAAGIDFATTGAASSSIAVGDVDGDGKPDLAFADGPNAGISVYRNTAISGSIDAGSFDPPINNFCAPYFDYEPFGVAIGDLDGDGYPDIVIPNYGHHNICVFHNNPLHRITGVTTVCMGNSTLLSQATTDGTWVSSSPAIATVNAVGLVTGITSGTAVISYVGTARTDLTGIAYGNIVTVTVTVSPTAVTASGAAAICSGSSATLTASGGTGIYSWSPATGLSAVTGASVSASPTVTTTYTVTGTGGISACGSNTATVTVTVNALSTAGAITAPATAHAGSVYAITTAGTGGVWSSSNTGVASIGAATGLVSCIAPGTAIISYTATGGCGSTLSTFTMTVTAGSAALLAPVTGPALYCAGNTGTLATVSAPGTGWSSSNTAVAAISPVSGVVTSFSAGTATITFTAYTGAIVTRTITVNPAAGAIGGTTAVCAGSTTSLTSAGGGTWASANTLRATVDASNGMVTGVSAGTALITNTLATGCKAFIYVTVNAAPAAIAGITALCTGSTTALSNATTGGTWSSGSPAVATIAAGGLVTAIAPGTSVISYSLAGGCSRTVTVTVSAAPAITGATSICIGNATTLSASPTGGTWTSASAAIASVGSATGIITGIAAGAAGITYTLNPYCKLGVPVTVSAGPATIGGPSGVCLGATATLTDATSGGTWSSSNPAVATITSAGIVSGLTQGSATITYTMGAACYQVKAFNVGATMSPITGATGLCVGLNTTFTSILPAAGQSWASSNTAIATVGSLSGVATGVAPGTVQITFTPYAFSMYAGCVATKIVTVAAVPTIAPITGPASVAVGHTIMLADATPGGVWSSSAPARATVSATGMVTGVSAPAAIISYSVTNGACVYPLTRTITVTATRGAGAELTEAHTAFSVYPNPTAGTFTISTSVSGVFTIYTLEGKLILQSEMAAGLNEVTMLNDLAAGVYLCRFNGTDGSSDMARLIYQP